MRSLGILTEFFARSPLPEQIPKPVELHVHVVEPAPVVGRQSGALIEQCVLFGNKRFDMLVQFLIVHSSCFSRAARLYPMPDVRLSAGGSGALGAPVRTETATAGPGAERPRTRS
jgi:hypothetical protein